MPANNDPEWPAVFRRFFWNIKQSDADAWNDEFKEVVPTIRSEEIIAAIRWYAHNTEVVPSCGDLIRCVKKLRMSPPDGCTLCSYKGMMKILNDEKVIWSAPCICALGKYKRKRMPHLPDEETVRDYLSWVDGLDQEDPWLQNTLIAKTKTKINRRKKERDERRTKE